MRQQTRGSSSVSPTFESRTPGEIVAISLAMMTVMVAVVAVISEPRLLVAIAAVAAAVRMRRVVTVPLARRARDRLAVEQPRPAAE